ncbi:hypothetical protein [Proteiniclasticum sediminis]|nr:hypothetical protein [Proteiniclasticum sediminis]
MGRNWSIILITGNGEERKRKVSANEEDSVPMRGWKPLMEAYGADYSTKVLQRFFSEEPQGLCGFWTELRRFFLIFSEKPVDTKKPK